MAEGAREPVIRRFLPEIVYGANDGLITTLAIVSGVVGAHASARLVLILGFASLFADGFSMGASDYLSNRSVPDANERPERRESLRKGVATFAGFIAAGAIPLIAWLLARGTNQFTIAVAATLVTLFAIGSARALFSDRSWLRAGMEMLLVGSLAAAVAYGLGSLGSRLTAGM